MTSLIKHEELDVHYDKRYPSPLWYFSLHAPVNKVDRYEIVKKLLKHGADVNKGHYMARSLFKKQLLAYVKDVDILKLLMEKDILTRYPMDFDFLNSPEGDEILDYYTKYGARFLSHGVISRIEDHYLENEKLVDYLIEEYRRYPNRMYHIEDFNKLKHAILHKGVDVDVTDAESNTALHLCITNTRIVEFLIENKADVNFKNKYGETPLHKLISSFVDEKWNPRKEHVFNLLLSYGADVVIKNMDGNTPFHDLNSNYFENTKDFLKFSKIVLKHADVHIKNNRGETCLFSNLLEKNNEFNNDTSILVEFIRRGADINAVDKEGDTMLHIIDNYQLISLLLSYGAKVNIKNNRGETALDNEHVIQFM